MTPTDYTRLLADYAQACDLIAEQKRQIEALRAALRPLSEAKPWASSWDGHTFEIGEGMDLVTRIGFVQAAREAFALQPASEPLPTITAEQIAAGEEAVRSGKWVTVDELRKSLPASEPKPTTLLGEIHEIQRIEAILKGGSTPATPHSALPSDPDDGC